MENEYSINLLNKKHTAIINKWPTLNTINARLFPERLLYPTTIRINNNKYAGFGKYCSKKYKDHSFKEWLILNKHEVLDDK